MLIGLLEFRRADDFAEELIGLQQDVVLKKDVVNADDAFFAQDAVVEIGQPAPHLEADAEMRIVIEIGAGRNDPIDEPGAHQRNDRGHAEAGGRHGARKTHADGDVVRENPFGEKMAGFAESRGIVGVKGLVDQIDDGDVAVDRRWLIAVRAGSGFYCSSQYSNWNYACSSSRSRFVRDNISDPYNFVCMNEAHIESLQKALQQDKLDGWLFYSFRGSDPIAENILRLDHAKFTTRRWFYFVPANGVPQKIVHAIEPDTLDSLPGDKHVYLPWQQLHRFFAKRLRV